MAVGVTAAADGSLRMGVGGIADRPHAEAVPADLSSAGLDDYANGLAWRLSGYDDIHASARYRRDLLRRLAPRLIQEAQACAA